MERHAVEQDDEGPELRRDPGASGSPDEPAMLVSLGDRAPPDRRLETGWARRPPTRRPRATLNGDSRS